jgi:hypothetical protein
MSVELELHQSSPVMEYSVDRETCWRTAVNAVALANSVPVVAFPKFTVGVPAELIVQEVILAFVGMAESPTKI